jgi:hypothetical protein
MCADTILVDCLTLLTEDVRLSLLNYGASSSSGSSLIPSGW